MKQWLLDVRAHLHSGLFFGASILCTWVYLMGWIETEPTDLLYFYTMTTTFGILYPMASCIAVLPSVSLLRDELRGAYCDQCVIRCGEKRHLLRKTALSMVLGGAALVLGIAIALLIQSFSMPLATEYWFWGSYMYAPELNTTFSDLITNGQYALFLILKLSLVFAHGCSACAMMIAASMLFRNPFTALFAPFVIMRSYDMFIAPLFGSALAAIAPMFNGFLLSVPMNNTWGYWGYVMGVQCLVWILCFFIAYLGMKRRRNHA